MANTITVTKHLDGPRHAVFHVYLKGDGSAGEVTDQIIIDPALLTPALTTKARFRIDDIKWSFSTGLGVRFEYNSIPDSPIWTCFGSHHINFEDAGGLQDRSGLDGGGALQITTIGLDSAAKQGTFIIKITK